MESPPPYTDPLWNWLFPRDYFRSMQHWRRDVLACCALAGAVASTDLVNFLIVAVPLVAAWLLIRYAIAANTSAEEPEPIGSHFERHNEEQRSLPQRTRRSPEDLESELNR